jgi:hypothetical protein
MTPTPALYRLHGGDIHVLVVGQDEDGQYGFVDGNRWYRIGRVFKDYGRHEGLITMQWTAVDDHRNSLSADSRKKAIAKLLLVHQLRPIREDETIPQLFALTE